MKFNSFTIFVNEDMALNQSVGKLIADEEKSFQEMSKYLEREKNSLMQQSKETQAIIGATKNLEKQRLLKNKLLNIKKQTEELNKKKEELEDNRDKKIIELKNLQQNLKQAEERLSNTQQQTNVQSTETEISENDENDENREFIIRRKFANMKENETLAPTSQPQPQLPSPVAQKPKMLIVNFDKSTNTPFQVKFTERGFLIGKTRLSFENLEDAISKEYNIALENGTGLVLDAVRLQKILKYKDRT